MKKYLIIPIILLLAAACSKQPVSPGASQGGPVAPVGNQQNQTSASSTTDTTPPIVSINQGGVYQNFEYNVKLNYSGLQLQTQEVSSYIPAGDYLGKDKTTDLLTLYLKPSIYQGTDLESAWLNLTASNTINQASCYQYVNTDGTNVYATYNLDKIRTVQGDGWHYTEPHPIGGVAAGHSSNGELYRLYKNNICYEVVLGASDFNRQNLENPNSVKDYNLTQILDYLGAAFNRLKINSPVAMSLPVKYNNTQYGFIFSLPEDWKGYSVNVSSWQSNPDETNVTESGPFVSINHPLSTAQKPRQDIPILIFTQKQWNDLQQDKFHIGAAPIGPTELGSNSKYVFALPARYNFSFATGYEEVEKIMQSSPLKAY